MSRLFRPVFASPVFAALACALVLAACTGKDAVAQGDGTLYQFSSATKLGQTIPMGDRKAAGDVNGDLLNGGTYNLNSDAGKVVVLNFWASWCSPCRSEMPGFDSLYRQDKASIDFVGINTKDASVSSAKAFVSDTNISYPIVRDEPGKVALELGKIPSGGLPFTVVLDKQHRVAAVYLQELQAADLQPVLTKLSAES
jgi:thiol-disulfide isomerase/thioredoxin